MNPAANHCPLPKFALWSLALDSVRQIFRPFGPLFPRNPFFPALRSGHPLFQRPSPGKQFLSSNGPHLKSKFLAIMIKITQIVQIALLSIICAACGGKKNQPSIIESDANPANNAAKSIDEKYAKFADVNWLSSSATVKRIAQEKKYEYVGSENSRIAYKTTIGNVPALVIFHIIEDKLVAVNLQLDASYQNYSAKYSELEYALIKKYGEPTISIRRNHPPYREGDDEVRVLKDGKAQILTAWENIGLKIEVMHIHESDKLIIDVEYESRYCKEGFGSLKTTETKDL